MSTMGILKQVRYFKTDQILESRKSKMASEIRHSIFFIHYIMGIWMGSQILMLNAKPFHFLSGFNGNVNCPQEFHCGGTASLQYCDTALHTNVTAVIITTSVTSVVVTVTYLTVL